MSVFVVNYTVFKKEAFMPYCPECGYEYREGVRTCPDCGQKLQDEAPQPSPPSPNVKFKALPSLPGRVYAEMLKGVLDQEGIPCYIHADGFSNATGVTGTGPVSKGVKVYVPEDRYEECLRFQHGMLDHI
jgi:hypothetical protein